MITLALFSPLGHLNEEVFLAHMSQHLLLVLGPTGPILEPLLSIRPRQQTPLPKPAWFGYLAKFGYVMGARSGGATLGNVLIWTGSPIYPPYRSGDSLWSLSPLQDQGGGGSIMMLESLVVIVRLTTWLMLDFAWHDTERQELLDLAHERGVLEEDRAGRAVGPRRGAALRERIEGSSRSG